MFFSERLTSFGSVVCVYDCFKIPWYKQILTYNTYHARLACISWNISQIGLKRLVKQRNEPIYQVYVKLWPKVNWHVRGSVSLWERIGFIVRKSKTELVEDYILGFVGWTWRLTFQGDVVVLLRIHPHDQKISATASIQFAKMMLNLPGSPHSVVGYCWE